VWECGKRIAYQIFLKTWNLFLERKKLYNLELYDYYYSQDIFIDNKPKRIRRTRCVEIRQIR
jgi:hypothetical protein